MRLWVVVVCCVAVFAGGAVAVLAASDPTTGTNTACATVSTPSHVIGVDSTAVYTISGSTTSHCNTVTYTIPTSTITSTGTYDQLTLGYGPVALYDLAGSGIDASGHGHTGTFQGGTPSQTSMPNGDSASVFNGSSQFLTVPTNSVFSIPTTHQLTWEGWIRPRVLNFSTTAGDNDVDWMGKCAQYSPTCEWEARIYNTSTPLESPNRPNRLSAYVFNPIAGRGAGADWQPGGSNYPTTQDQIIAGHWYFIVGEYQTLTNDGASGCSTPIGTINIWVNGVPWNQADHSPTGCMSQYGIVPQANNSPLNIGTMAQDGFFDGAIGKVAIFDSLLSQAQISAQYTRMTGLAPSGSCGSTCTLTSP